MLIGITMFGLAVVVFKKGYGVELVENAIEKGVDKTENFKNKAMPFEEGVDERVKRKASKSSK
jgi:hypothetical protein